MSGRWSVLVVVLPWLGAWECQREGTRLDIVLTVEPELEVYEVGQEVTLTVDVRNRGAEPMYSWWIADQEDTFVDNDVSQTVVLDGTITVHVSVSDPYYDEAAEASVELLVAGDEPETWFLVSIGDGGGVVVLPDGTRCQNQCRVEGRVRDVVTLRAEPHDGYEFAGWNRCSSATTPEIDITLSSSSPDCVAVFAPAQPDCDDPLVVALELVDPAEHCNDVEIIDGVEFPVVEVTTFSATVQASSSHPRTAIRWAAPLQDPSSPDFVDDFVIQKTVSLFTATTSGVAVQIDDDCSPARTEQAVLLVRQGDGKCP